MRDSVQIFLSGEVFSHSRCAPSFSGYSAALNPARCAPSFPGYSAVLPRDELQSVACVARCDDADSANASTPGVVSRMRLAPLGIDEGDCWLEGTTQTFRIGSPAEAEL